MRLFKQPGEQNSTVISRETNDQKTKDSDVFSMGSSDDDDDNEEENLTGIDARVTKQLQLEEASSLIGGSPVYHRHSVQHSISDIDELNLDDGISDTEFPEVLDEKAYKSSHKIFSFSLPFGGNPLSHLPSLKLLRNGISANPDTEEDDFNVKVDENEIRTKLARHESIDTLQEAYLFRNMKGQGSSRLQAVKRAFTPTISLASILDDEKKKESIWDTIDGDIIILGGFRGSVLRDAHTQKRVWVPLRAGFNIRKIDLRVGPTDEDENHAEEYIYPDGMLTHIGPIDIARNLKRKLKNGKTRVRTFGYDWRLSSDINSEKLFEYLQNIKKSNKNGQPPLVIAHSMGGLISHHVMQKDPTLFRGLIYVGVPAECPNILGPIRFGDSVLFNNKILSPEANFLMRSSFVFLPKNGRCFIDRKTNKKYNLNFFDPDVWTEHCLSPLVSKERRDRSSNPVTKQLPDEFMTSYEDSKRYLARTLKRTAKFLDELAYDGTKKYPPLVMVYGDQVPTVRGARVDGIEGIARGEYDDFYYGPGDGVVNHKWLMPERRGFPLVSKLASDQGHISLLTDLDIMGQAIEDIISAEKVKLANGTNHV